MKATQTCPKCAGKKFAVMAEFRQPDPQSSNLTEPFPAITTSVATGFFGDRKSFGRFETWICVGCGYTEFYAKGLRNLDAIAQQYPDQVSLVDATPASQGPYR